MKKKLIQLRFSEKEYNEVKEAAIRSHLKTATFVRLTILKEIEKNE